MSRETDPYNPCADETTGGPGCTTVPLERLKFWNGRFVVARDLQHQQDDLIRRLEYHQRFAHGEGILCGFSIRRHPRDECERDWLVVEPGMAYDCCGRTLWMPKSIAVRIPGRDRRPESDAPRREATYAGEEKGYRGEEAMRVQAETGPWEVPESEYVAEAHDAERGGSGDREEDEPGAYRDERDDHPGRGRRPGRQEGEDRHGDGNRHDDPSRLPDPEWFIAARRVDCPTDPQPALYSDDLCEPIRHLNGRVREDVELHVLRAEEVSQECWPRWRPASDEDCDGDIQDDCLETRGDTVPCGHACACGNEWVLLAGVWRDTQGRLRWDTTHRKVLMPPTALTRITGVNWPHGGDISLRRLADQMRGRLVVRFSRRLRPADGFQRGINPMTFEVSYLGQSGAWEQVLVPEEGEEGEPTPRLSENGRCAVFTIPRPLLTGRLSLAGKWVRVRLLGDFILDCHGRAVSAAHTGGDVNGRGTGNGVPGGTFESWFYVRDSRKEESR